MSLIIATPVRAHDVYSAQVCMGFAEQMRNLPFVLKDEVSQYVVFAADVVRARNRIAAKVLRERPEATHVLWWDDDEWIEDLTIIQKMMELNEDLVSVPYTNKNPPLRWIHQNLHPQPEPVDGIIDVWGVGFGFTMTSRACLEKMSAAARKYTDGPNHDSHKVANLFGQLFDRCMRPGEDPEEEQLLSEDFSFCKRWRELGGRVKIMMRAPVVHHVGGHGWSAREMPGGVVGVVG